MAEISKIRKNGVDYDIKDAAARAEIETLKRNPGGYATEQYVQNYAQPKGDYLTEVPDGYAKTEDIPTKMSALENDSGYQTAEQVTAIVQAQLGVIENGTY